MKFGDTFFLLSYKKDVRKHPEEKWNINTQEEAWAEERRVSQRENPSSISQTKGEFHKSHESLYFKYVIILTRNPDEA